MTYRHYASCVDSLRRRQASDLLLDPSANKHSVRLWLEAELALRSWLLHNKALLALHEQHPKSCLLISQEAQVHGESLVLHANQRFDLSLDSKVATGIDIKKRTYKKIYFYPWSTHNYKQTLNRLGKIANSSSISSVASRPSKMAIGHSNDWGCIG